MKNTTFPGERLDLTYRKQSCPPTGMKIGQQLQFIVINKQAHSLYSLIADEHYHPTSLGRVTWKRLIGSQASLQRNCNREGFNVLFGNEESSKARIGIVANNENDCYSCDSGIGFGTGAQEGCTTTLTHVVTKPCTTQIMVIYILKPWDTSWYNEKEIFHIIPIIFWIDEMNISRIMRLLSWICTCVSI